MHWRKPFPPRSVRPSAIAELRTLIVSSLDPNVAAGKGDKPDNENIVERDPIRHPLAAD